MSAASKRAKVKARAKALHAEMARAVAQADSRRSVANDGARASQAMRAKGSHAGQMRCAG